MNKTIETAINEQIKEEIYSAYLYLSMSAYAEENKLFGIANWFDVQAKEEMDHAKGFFNFLLKHGGIIELQAIPKPPAEFDGPLGMFTDALAHEKEITAKINKLYELGNQEKDYDFVSWLKWYIDEQEEEEESASKILGKIKLAGKAAPGMFMVDKELAKRQYTPASIITKQKKS